MLMSGCISEEKPTKRVMTTEKKTTSTIKETTLETTTTVKTTITSTTISHTVTKDISDLALKPSDLTGNYRIKDRGPRLRSDVDEEAIKFGWKEGYYIKMERGESLSDITIIEQAISRYPCDTISDVLHYVVNKMKSMENVTVEELPSLDIGDESKAFRMKMENDLWGELKAYGIIFIKDDIYETIMVSGTSTDYEILKEAAKKAESKIE